MMDGSRRSGTVMWGSQVRQVLLSTWNPTPETEIRRGGKELQKTLRDIDEFASSRSRPKIGKIKSAEEH